MKLDMILSVPLYLWAIIATLLVAIAFAAGWSLHKSHILIKNAPKSVKKPKPEKMPEGWTRWEI